MGGQVCLGAAVDPPVQVVEDVAHVVGQDDTVLAHVAVVPQHAHGHVRRHFGQLPQDVVEGPRGHMGGEACLSLHPRVWARRQGTPRVHAMYPASHPEGSPCTRVSPDPSAPPVGTVYPGCFQWGQGALAVLARGPRSCLLSGEQGSAPPCPDSGRSDLEPTHLWPLACTLCAY